MKSKLKKFIKRIVLILYHLEIKFLKIKDNVILFESSGGRNYTGNPKAIYEKMVELGLDKKYKLIWSFEDTNIGIIGNAKKIKKSRLKYFYYMAISKVWIFDSRQPKYAIKRKECKYIQTWHGTPLKKLALDMDKVNMGGSINIESYHKNFYNSTRDWDYLISQNEFSTEIFKRCFAFDKQMLEIGYPRNDILINDNNIKNIERIKQKLNLPQNKKIILYAPTWRDNEFYKKGVYKFVTKLDYQKMYDSLSDEYILLLKYHYLVKDKIDTKKYNGFIYKCNEKIDISELYLISDILVTDYSSVMFDYSLLKRPMFFFAYDLEEYKNNLRGFYFDFIKEVPGPISVVTDELINDIKNYDENKWKVKKERFYKKFNSKDNGMASQKICDLICGISSK